MGLEHTEKRWEEIFIGTLSQMREESRDFSHDLGHFQRVARNARAISRYEDVASDPLILLASAYFHDVVSLPKDHPERHLSSLYAAEKAQEILESIHFPREKITGVYHAIRAHSFSGNVTPQTIEAKIIQDADRLEALGALGVIRLFYVAGRIGSQPYDTQDLFATKRPLDEKTFAFDHFFCKLLKLPQHLQTQGGKQLATKLVDFLHVFIDELAQDLQTGGRGAIHIALTCHEGGMLDRPLFDNSDVFAANRPLDRYAFVVDGIVQQIEEYPQFIPRFLQQLESEIHINSKK